MSTPALPEPAGPRHAVAGPGPMWHVTLTVAGDAVAEADIRAGLERLAHEHPFLLAGRFATDRAEIRYWDEAPDAASVTELALDLWAEHSGTSGLPPWQVVALEIVDRDTFHRRGRHVGAPGLVTAGRIAPF